MIPESGEVSVLVTVKAAPQPSTKYRDTVCVAGLYLPAVGVPELIRLYPVPFRYLTEEQQFAKYEIRRFTIAMNPKDNRPESRRVEFGNSVELVKTLPKWKARAEIVEQVEPRSMCEIQRSANEGRTGPSLGVVRPSEITGIKITPTPPLDAGDRQRRERLAAQGELNLFDEAKRRVSKALELPPFRAHLRYRCTDSGCKGHTQGILDWELTELQRRRRREGVSDEQLKTDITRNFFENATMPDRDPRLYVGNQANPARRRTFSVLGIYNPKRTDLPPALGPLF